MVFLTKIKCVSSAWVHSDPAGLPVWGKRFRRGQEMSPLLSRRALFGRAARTHSPRIQGPLVAVLGGGCLAVQGIACGTCSDPCEPGALKVRPLPGGRAIPLIDAAACTGCGDCLNVCPVGALNLALAGVGESKPCA